MYPVRKLTATLHPQMDVLSFFIFDTQKWLAISFNWEIILIGGGGPYSQLEIYKD